MLINNAIKLNDNEFIVIFENGTIRFYRIENLTINLEEIILKQNELLKLVKKLNIIKYHLEPTGFRLIHKTFKNLKIQETDLIHTIRKLTSELESLKKEAGFKTLSIKEVDDNGEIRIYEPDYENYQNFNYGNQIEEAKVKVYKFNK